MGFFARMVWRAVPIEYWCPCLRCVIWRDHMSPHRARRAEIRKRDKAEPWLPAGIRLTEPNGSMYGKSKEH